MKSVNLTAVAIALLAAGLLLPAPLSAQRGERPAERQRPAVQDRPGAQQQRPAARPSTERPVPGRPDAQRPDADRPQRPNPGAFGPDAAWLDPEWEPQIDPFFRNPATIERLGLSESQSAALEQSFEKTLEGLREVRPQLFEARQTLAEEMAKTKPDLGVVNSAIDKLHEIRAENMKLALGHRVMVKSVLSEEQFAKLQAYRAQRPAAPDEADAQEREQSSEARARAAIADILANEELSWQDMRTLREHMRELPPEAQQRVRERIREMAPERGPDQREWRRPMGERDGDAPGRGAQRRDSL